MGLYGRQTGTQEHEEPGKGHLLGRVGGGL